MTTSDRVTPSPPTVRGASGTATQAWGNAETFLCSLGEALRVGLCYTRVCPQLLGETPKPFSKFHVPSISLSIGCIDGLLYFPVINFILNHRSHERDALSVSR